MDTLHRERYCGGRRAPRERLHHGETRAAPRGPVQRCAPAEFGCILNCIDGVISDAGSASNSAKAGCAASCPSSDSGSGTIDVTTNDLFACASATDPEAGASCNVVCLGG